MALLEFGPKQFDADMVVLDKDGTLVDFDYMWGRFAQEWIAELLGMTMQSELERPILDTLGYDSDRQVTRPCSALVSGSAEQLQAMVATLLVQSGQDWPDAIASARASFGLVFHRSPPHQRVRSFGDIVATLANYRSHGLKISVVTTDDREPTQYILGQLGVSHLVDTMVCGDDGIAWKPAPDMLLAACERLAVLPERVVVVGDTVADMGMARSGGAGLAVAVLSGVGDEERLRQLADVVLPSIADLGHAV